MKINFPHKILENQRVFSLAEDAEHDFRLSQNLQEESQIKEEGKSSLELEKTRKLTEALNQLFKAFDLELRFTVHEPTGEIIARIVNRQTGDVIREIPPEKFLDMIARLRELVGIFVDEIV